MLGPLPQVMLQLLPPRAPTQSSENHQELRAALEAMAEDLQLKNLTLLYNE